MKKITLLAIAALAISFASCKKDYKCTCTQTNSLVAGSDVTVYTYKGVSKGTAKKRCVNYDSYDNDYPTSVNSYACELSK